MIIHRASRFRRALRIVVVAGGLTVGWGASAAPGTYQNLVSLFADWETFERPPLLNGALDYTAGRSARRRVELKAFQARLAAIDPAGWPVDQQVDHQLVRAAMNGLDFDLRVLQPWARDPAFYKSIWTEQSDTPAHEGPTHTPCRAVDIQFSAVTRGRGQAGRAAAHDSAAAGAGATSTSPATRVTCGSPAPERCGTQIRDLERLDDDTNTAGPRSRARFRPRGRPPTRSWRGSIGRRRRRPARRASARRTTPGT